MEIFAPNDVKTVTWNGKQLKTSKSSYGSLKATIAAPVSIQLPAFTSWKVNDSLPERLPTYDASGLAWVGQYILHFNSFTRLLTLYPRCKPHDNRQPQQARHTARPIR